MIFNLHRTEQSLLALKQDWDVLFSQSKTNNFFLSHAWNTATAQAYFQGKDILVATVYQYTQLIAVAPFVVSGGRIRFMRHPEIADYGDILALPDSSQAVIFLFEQLMKTTHWSCIELRNIPSTSILSSVVPHLKATKAYIIHQNLCKNPVIDLTCDFENHYKMRNKKKLRQEIRTTENHLNRLGKWRFEVATDAAEELKFLDALVTFHRKRQSKKDGRSVFENPQHLIFFENLIKNPLISENYKENYKIQLSAITLSGRVISVAFSLLIRDQIFYWIPSFDKSLHRMSLGKLHIKELIGRCKAEGFTKFDFMGGEEPYKYQWATGSYYIECFTLYRSCIQYLGAVMVHGVVSKLRKIKQKSVFVQKLWTIKIRLSKANSYQR